MKKAFFSAFSFLLIACANPQIPAEQKAEPEQSSANLSTQSSAPDERGYLVKVGQMVPDVMLHLTSGDSIQLSTLKGKLVMLQFTASWCGVCRKEMPHIEKQIWNKHKDNPHFALFGVDREEPLETVNEFARKVGATYPMSLDLNADIFGAFADLRAGITRNVIIDETGQIIMLTRLFNEDEFNAMVQLIDTKLQNLTQNK